MFSRPASEELAPADSRLRASRSRRASATCIPLSCRSGSWVTVTQAASPPPGSDFANGPERRARRRAIRPRARVASRRALDRQVPQVPGSGPDALPSNDSPRWEHRARLVAQEFPSCGRPAPPTERQLWLGSSAAASVSGSRARPCDETADDGLRADVVERPELRKASSRRRAARRWDRDGSGAAPRIREPTALAPCLIGDAPRAAIRPSPDQGSREMRWRAVPVRPEGAQTAPRAR